MTFILDSPVTIDGQERNYLVLAINNPTAYGPNKSSGYSANTGGMAGDLDEYVKEVSADDASSSISVSQSSIVVGSSVDVTVTVKNAKNESIKDASVTLFESSASKARSATQTSFTDSHGVATFSVSSTLAQTITYEAEISVGGIDTFLTDKAEVTYTSGPARELDLLIQPSDSAVSGLVFEQQPLVQLVDEYGNVVSAAGVVVTTALASGNGTLDGILTATTDANGRAFFSELSISGLVGFRTLSFSVPNLTGAVSDSVEITAAAANKLAVTVQPSASASSGVLFDRQPIIQLQDAFGNAVSNADVEVTASIASGTPKFGKIFVIWYGLALLGLVISMG
jgi:hypothetical protein